ncbi:hypothetical protein Tco_1029316 [Tanacetum coccineum]|uniref:Uncharacterized protein n=1 Tax=Tanacetum coccineum TaxID=301880 RepID=A0ABQ5G3F0_9ASTR
MANARRHGYAVSSLMDTMYWLSKHLEAIDDGDVPLVDGVLNGALGAFGDRGCCFNDEVLASSCVRSINNLLGGIIVIFGFLEALKVEA